jgi:nitrogen-specific signal transduction histidine kinase
MTAGTVSLLDFLDAPVVIGDPDSRVVYVNAAFESSSRISSAAAKGQPLAGLFEGGGREAVLRAAAGACETGASVRFRLRLNEIGYAALASPIKANENSVGVVILLTEELENDPRVLALHREIHEPLDEITRCLAELSEATGGLRSSRYRQALDDGARALDAVRKHAEEIQKILDGKN